MKGSYFALIVTFLFYIFWRITIHFTRTGTMIVLLFVLSGLTVSAESVTYYVSNSHPGASDANDGQTESTPWETIAKVNSTPVSGDVVLFRRGDIFRGQVDVRQPDIHYGAYDTGDNPVISGSVLIESWTVHNGNVWVADVTDDIHHLFVNGELMTIGRYPNTGWLNVESSADKSTITDSDLTANPNNAPDYWIGATVRLRTFSWLFETFTVVSDDGNGTITLDHAASQTMASNIQPEWGFYLDGKLAEVDTPGEWYYDPVDSNVYFYPPGGINPDTATIEGSVTDYGFKIYWQKHNTIVEDFTIRHQAKVGVRINQCNGAIIRNNAFRHCLDKGINMEWNSSDQQFTGNVFDDMLNFAIVWNSQSSFDVGTSLIENNTILNTAMIPGYGGDGVTQSIAIRVMGQGVQIRSNTIDSTGYVGMILSSSGHIVEYNTITNSLQTLDDGGGILVGSDNNQIRYNYIASSWGNRGPSSGTNNGSYFRQMGMGIFFLSNLTGNVVEGNIVVDNVDFGIYPDRAGSTIISDNVCYNNRYQLYMTSSGSGNTIEDNVFYSLAPDQICMRVDGDVDYGTFDRNYYCNPYSSVVIEEKDSPYGYPRYSLAHWQSQYPLRDQNSVDNLVDFSFYAVTGSSGNLITNSFFDTHISGWTDSGPVTISHSAARMLDGGSMQGTYSGSGTGNIRPSADIGLTQDQFYRLRFSGLADDFGNWRITFFDQTTSPGWTILNQTYYAMSITRQEYEFFFQSPVTTIESKPWFAVDEDDASAFWLDNITLEPLTVTMNDPKHDSPLFSNMTASPQSFFLGGQNYFDLDGNPVSGSILVPAYSTVILTSDDSVSVADIEIDVGWNIIGLPLDVADPYYLSIFTVPPAISGSLYEFNGDYQSADSLEFGKGYWLRFSEPDTVQIVGLPVDSICIDVLEGWNMIAGPSCEVQLANVQDAGDIIIDGTLYRFTGSYQSATAIEQGEGYWIRVTADGQLCLGCSQAAVASHEPGINLPENTAQLIISDANGGEQTLYFNSNLSGLSYSLPPVPP
ncbi:MAG: right-handed parallel beta-helix repeat-containing protein, partial [Planctomycetes bacterium]|nr:right-handed parallel beta-helix repeat-containing protein [Planctomycetota bacterium]